MRVLGTIWILLLASYVIATSFALAWAHLGLPGKTEYVQIATLIPLYWLVMYLAGSGRVGGRRRRSRSER